MWTATSVLCECCFVLKLFDVLLDYKAESMSGPIVRTGTTPEFWKNWDRAFGDKKATAGTKKATKAPEKKEAAVASKKAVKKAAPKAAPQKASKKATKKTK
jgi:hypothetical protein